jgi:hypothetical protein
MATLNVLTGEQKKILSRVAREGPSDPADLKLIAALILRLFDNIEELAAQQPKAVSRRNRPSKPGR